MKSIWMLIIFIMFGLLYLGQNMTNRRIDVLEQLIEEK